MPAARYDFKIEQGATFQRTITWKDSNGNPIDLTGYKIRLQARINPNDKDPIIDLSTSPEVGGIEILTPAGNGQFRITMDASDTASLDFAEALYDLEAEDPDGNVTRLLEGTIELSREITK